MIHALVTGDLHLMGLQRLFPQDHIKRQLTELDKIFNYAVTNQIKHVFVAGDISDTPILPNEAYGPLLTLLKLYDPHISISYIAGNHDFHDNKTTSMDLLKVLCDNGFFQNFRLYLTPKIRKINKVPVAFLPFPQNSRLEVDHACLNIAHVEYNNAKGDNGRPIKTEHEFRSNPQDFNISGHIHTYQYLKKQRAIYPGNPYQKNFGESLPKGFIEIKARLENSRVEVKHRFVNNQPNFTLQTLHIQSTSDFSKIKHDDNTRLRLILDEDMLVPDNLMLRIPSIRQVIKHSGKILDLETTQLDVTPQELQAIDPFKGLNRVLRQQGHNKKDQSRSRSLVQEALQELGYV